MKINNKYVWVLLGVAACMLIYSCYKCYKWHEYKSQCDEILREMKTDYTYAKGLTYSDYIVLTGDVEAYLKCNSMISLYRHGFTDSILLPREYLLYCYIFAIRDNNLEAASEFSINYLQGIDDGVMPYDTAMMGVAIEFLTQAVHLDTCDTDSFYKWHALSYLQNIYSGKYDATLKDDVLYKRYTDAIMKFSKKR